MGRRFRRIGIQFLCRLHLDFSQQPYLRVLFSFGKVLWVYNTFKFHMEPRLLRAFLQMKGNARRAPNAASRVPNRSEPNGR